MTVDTSGGDILTGSRASLTLYVQDVDSAAEWYSAVFGCDPIYRGTDRSLEGAATTVVAFRLAGLKVFLSPAKRPSESQGAARPTHSTLVFMTTRELKHVHDELASRGAIFDNAEHVDDFPANKDGIRVGRDADFFWFYDPVGNRMEFCRVHSDRIDILSLMCMHPAKIGGHSFFASSLAVYETVKKEQPEYLEILERGSPQWRNGEQTPGDEEITPYCEAVTMSITSPPSLRVTCTCAAASSGGTE